MCGKRAGCWGAALRTGGMLLSVCGPSGSTLIRLHRGKMPLPAPHITPHLRSKEIMRTNHSEGAQGRLLV